MHIYTIYIVSIIKRKENNTSLISWMAFPNPRLASNGAHKAVLASAISLITICP